MNLLDAIANAVNAGKNAAASGEQLPPNLPKEQRMPASFHAREANKDIISAGKNAAAIADLIGAGTGGVRAGLPVDLSDDLFKGERAVREGVRAKNNSPLKQGSEEGLENVLHAAIMGALADQSKKSSGR